MEKSHTFDMLQGLSVTRLTFERRMLERLDLRRIKRADAALSNSHLGAKNSYRKCFCTVMHKIFNYVQLTIPIKCEATECSIYLSPRLFSFEW